MHEDDVKRIATELIAESGLDSCSIESLQRFHRDEIGTLSTNGDEWVVRFAFDQDDDVATSSEVAIVMVNDSTGDAHLMDSL